MTTEFDIGDEVLLKGTVVAANMLARQIKSTEDVSIMYNIQLSNTFGKDTDFITVTVEEKYLINTEHLTTTIQNILKDVTDEDLIAEMARRGLIGGYECKNDAIRSLEKLKNIFDDMDNAIVIKKQ